jgi:cyclase
MKLQQVSENCFAVLNEKNHVCDANSGLINLENAVLAVAKAKGIEVEF